MDKLVIPDYMLPKRGGVYAYLDAHDSARLDATKDSLDPRDREIAELILSKAASSRSAHCASNY